MVNGFRKEREYMGAEELRDAVGGICMTEEMKKKADSQN